jgi:hypothetical protein
MARLTGQVIGGSKEPARLGGTLSFKRGRSSDAIKSAVSLD